MKVIPCVMVDRGGGWNRLDVLARAVRGVDAVGLVGDACFLPPEEIERFRAATGARVVHGARLRVIHEESWVEGVLWPMQRRVVAHLAAVSRRRPLMLSDIAKTGGWWMPVTGPRGERFMVDDVFPLMGVVDERERALAKKYGRDLAVIRESENPPLWLRMLIDHQENDAVTKRNPPSWEDVERRILDLKRKPHDENMNEWITSLRGEYYLFCEYGVMSGLWMAAQAIDIMRQHGAIGPGRGSVCASRLAYALGVTGIDPAIYRLRVERFVGGREGMPDIDIDVERKRRDAMVGALARSSWRAVGLSSLVYWAGPTALRAAAQRNRVPPHVLSATIQRCGERTVNEALAAGDLAPREWVLEASAIEGRVMQRRAHPSAVMLKGDDVVAIHDERGIPVCAWTPEDAEVSGRMVLDVLSSRAVEVIAEAKRIESKVPTHVPEMTWWGLTQMGTPAMRRWMEEHKPKTIDEAADLIALRRPGPQKAGMDEVYFGRQEIPWPKEVAELLERTRGALIYQEQWDLVVGRLLGLTLEEADQLRRRCAKGDIPENAAQALNKHLGPSLANTMIALADASFCQAHAVAYAKLMAEGRRLMKEKPLSWWAALLRCRREDPLLILAARAAGVKILPPVFPGHWQTTPVEDGLRLGLEHIKGLSAKVQQAKHVNELTAKDRSLLIDAGALDASLLKKWGAPVWKARVQARFQELGIEKPDHGDLSDWLRACHAEEAALGVPLKLSIMQCYRDHRVRPINERTGHFIAKVAVTKYGAFAYDETGLIEIDRDEIKEGIFVFENFVPVRKVDPHQPECLPPAERESQPLAPAE